MMALGIPASERDPGPQWWLPSVPRVQNSWNASGELPGEEIPERPIFDHGTQGVSSSSIGFGLESSRYQWDGHVVDNDVKGFWTRTMVAVPGGGVLGFDANDLRQGLAVSNDSRGTSVKTVYSPSQLRFGGGWDLLSPFLKDKSMSLGVEGWIPAWSDGETQLRIGFRHMEDWRVDVGVRERPQGVAGSRLDSAFLVDTLVPGGDQWIRDLRVGFRLGDVQGQLWGGLRTLDSGASGSAWQHSGRSWFGGMQVGFPVPLGNAVLQTNADAGHERQWVWREGRQFLSAAEISLLAAALDAELPVWTSEAMLVQIRAVHLSVDETLLQSQDLLQQGVSGSAGHGLQLDNVGVGFGWKHPIGSLSLRPTVTLARQFLSGDASAVWFAGAQGSEFLGAGGERTLLEGKCEISWVASGSRWSYQVGRTWAISGSGGFDISHRGALSQSF
jgi:hypothetical protein